MEKLLESQIERTFHARDFVQLLRQHGRLFVGLFVCLLFLNSIIYVYKIPYVGKARLIVHDSVNSTLQAFSSSYFGMSKSVAEGKKGNTQLGKLIELLHSREFFENLFTRLQERGADKSMSLDEQQAYAEIKEKYLDTAAKDPVLKHQFLLKLDSWAQFKLESDFEVLISFATPSQGLSLLLTNTAIDLASDTLKAREMDEIKRVEKFITQQKEQADLAIKSMAKELAEYQTQPANLISMTSKEKMGEYVSDLMVRINETKLKISENNQTIKYLNDGRPTNSKVSSLYGAGGKVEALKIENRMLQNRLAELQKTADRLSQQMKVLPVAMEMLEDKRKKSELEYAKYKELTETLARVEAQKVSIQDRFEILEKAHIDNTKPQIEWGTLAFLSFVLAQISGLAFIYLKYLWNPMVLQSEKFRNVMVFDDHNQDPRVIIENAKIKFQLGNQKGFENS